MGRAPLHESVVITDVVDQLPVTAQATTSRALLDTEAVRVVAFTFDTGEQLTEHTAAEPVLVQVIDGRLRFTVDGVSYELRAGDCVYLAPHAPHALEALEPTRLALVFVHGAG